MKTGADSVNSVCLWVDKKTFLHLNVLLHDNYLQKPFINDNSLGFFGFLGKFTAQRSQIWSIIKNFRRHNIMCRTTMKRIRVPSVLSRRLLCIMIKIICCV